MKDDTTIYGAWPTHEPLGDYTSSFYHRSYGPDYQAPTKVYKDSFLSHYMTPPASSNLSSLVKIHQDQASNESDSYIRPTHISAIPPDALAENPNAIEPIDFLRFTPWFYSALSPQTGITVFPKKIPETEICTFLGSLGHAKSKGFIIPVNKEGVPGWEKRDVRIDQEVVVLAPDSTGSGFITSTKIQGDLVPTSGTIGGQIVMTSIPYRMKPISRQTSTASTISNKPTPAHNAPFKESIKLASIQAFSQMGIILLALLVIGGVVGIFICISSFFKIPMPFLRKLSFGRGGMVRRESKKTNSCDINFEEFMGDATLNPYGRSRYLRGTAEAIDNNSSLQGGSQISGETNESGVSRPETTSITIAPNYSEHIGTIETPVIATGSQSKLTGVKLRRTRSF